MTSAQKLPRLSALLSAASKLTAPSSSPSMSTAQASTAQRPVAVVEKGIPPTSKIAWRTEPEHELTAPTAPTTQSRKRSSEQALEDGRPSKQARRDSAIDGQIARLQRALATPPAAPLKPRMRSDRGKVKEILVADAQRKRDEAGAQLAADRKRTEMLSNGQ